MHPDRAVGDDRSADDPPSELGGLEDMQAFWQELRGLSHDRLRLAALETQRAGLRLVDMLVAGVMAAALLFAAWLGLSAAAVLRLIENGMETSSALLLAVAGNLLLVLILAAAIRRNSCYLAFPALLRSIQTPPPVRNR
ncbi:phage holin family protein [Methylomonas rhizoryzae]|uniref:phage holin family protein n=1 Tax=Methylomonas rhizoryzae TaxID=2608981 RepID=UPI001231BD75|nr:phage holin family protein [Methylomonas rhizoryzae]